MDLATALHIRELGYTVRYSALLDSSFQETAEDTLLKSDLSSKICDFKNPTKSVFILSTSADGRHVASGHGDHNVYVSQLATGKVIHCLTGHRRTPWTVSFHPTRNDLLASGCLGGEIRVWDLKSGCSEVLRTEENTAVASLAFHPRDLYLAVATADKVLLWDWNQSYPFAVCQSGSVRERLRFVRFDPTGCILYTGITNPREMQEPARCMVTPPEVMPLRFREMIQSRNELLQMRAELSRSHQRMLQRYNELQSRYNELRQRYPELAAAAQSLESSFTDPASFVSSASSSNNNNTGYENNNNNNTNSFYESSAAAAWTSASSNASPQPPARPCTFSAINLEGNNNNNNNDVRSIEPVTDPLSFIRRRPEVTVTNSISQQLYHRPSFVVDMSTNEPSNVRSATVRLSDITRRFLLTPTTADDNSDRIQFENNGNNNNNNNHNNNALTADLSQPPLSPIALEGLRDAVAYAREITTQSMEQFVRQHHDSIARLQLSYRQISEQAQGLMQQFSQTLDEMKKLQEIVDKKYPNGPGQTTSCGQSTSAACAENSSGGQRTSGYALLEALSRMREVLEQPPNDELPTFLRGLSSYDQFSEQNQQRLQMENEISRLIKVQELIRDFDSTLPMNPATKVYLNHHKIVLNDIRRDVNNATDSQTLNFIRVRLTEEIKEFQSFVRAWKQDIMAKIQDNGVRLALKSDAHAQTRSVGKSDAQAQTSPVTSDNSMDDDQPGPSTSGYCTSSKTSVAPKRSTKEDPSTVSKETAGESSSNGGEEDFVSPTNKKRKVSSVFTTTISSVGVSSSEAAGAAESLKDVSISLRRVDDNNITPATPSLMDLLPNIERRNEINDEVSSVSQTESTDNNGRLAAPMLGQRSMVAINNAVELAMRRRQRLFAMRNSTAPPNNNNITNNNNNNNVQQSTTNILPDNTVRRVRQAAERLNYLERRTELLNEEVSRLSQRVAVDDNPLMTQMELLERREARLRSLHNSQVRALRDLTADNLRRLRSPSPASSSSSERQSLTTSFRRLIDHQSADSSSSSSRSDVLEVHRRSLSSEQQQRPTSFVPWHRRQTPPDNNNLPTAANVGANLFHLRTFLPDANEDPPRRAAYVILDRTVNVPAPQISWDEMEAEDRMSSFDLHRSVNRAIAGAFIGTGDVAVANNILDTTCRIQFWFVKRNQPPDISQASMNVILGRCKLNNDGSVSISEDGRLLAAFVENDREDKSLWAHTILKVVSLRPEDRGVVLYQKTFAPNAISVSISPAMGHILIGLASRRYLRLRHSPQTFAQVYRMCDSGENADKPRELKLSMNIEHRCNETPIEEMFTIRNESLNCAIWLKTPGHGICYGTNKGQVLILSGKENVVERRDSEKEKTNDEIEQQASSTGTMRVLFRRNGGRMNLLESRNDEQNQYRTVIV